ncbi:MAG: SpoIIE family protein phosphatase [Oscillospiraceae bacterium]|nr:SpoIIE family protein phosphatase [Oscillospiraceae bacterium]
MMVTIESYARRWQTAAKKLAVDPRVRIIAGVSAHFFGGMAVSAASLAQHCQPLALGLLCAFTGWRAAVLALGAAVGYLLFWGAAGYQGVLWIALALPVALILGRRQIIHESVYLMSAIAALIVSASGLFFQLFRSDTTQVSVYLLRIFLGAVSARLFYLVRDHRDPVADWLAEGIAVLALAQIAPFPGFSLGYIAAGLLAAGGALPAAALAGLALDLSRITATPMTGALCLAYLCRMIPYGRRWLPCAAPAAAYLTVMKLGGFTDLLPALGLALGGTAAVFLPPRPELSHRRGETGSAQVRLEMMAGVLAQTQQLLIESPGVPVDEEAVLLRAQERACGGCPCRKTCRERLTILPRQLLHRPMMDTASLPLSCKKPARLILELRRGQEQLRAIKADRDRQAEYRAALVQQYQFLSLFMQELSDQLPRRFQRQHQKFQAEVAMQAYSREMDNGDRCLWFAGTQCRYYVLLCDGMGTGIGAAQEGQTASSLLRQMLSAGFPAEHALRSLNSLLALRARAAAVTIDLAEIRLDTGRVTLYKWGAAPSLLLSDGLCDKIGTAGPPPGLSVTEGREMVERLSLRRGEVLVLLSDGVDGEVVRREIPRHTQRPPEELAADILECGTNTADDDATVVVIRLVSGALPTS